MKKHAAFAVIFLLSIVTSIQATSIRIPGDRETLCRCLGTYTRFQFEILDGSLINIKVVDSSSDEVCDAYHSQQLEFFWQRGSHYPDGVIGIAVRGTSAVDKNMNLEQCIGSEELETRIYFHLEETIIDLEKISRPLE